MCLCRLHNFCIDSNESIIEKMTVKYAQNVQQNVKFNNAVSGNSTNEDSVTIDENGCPTDLLNVGHHFYGAPKSRRTETAWCLMDGMIDEVKAKNLQRPRVKERINE